MQTAAQYLEGQTQTYWHISRIWNGRSRDIMETGDAIDECSNIMYSMNPARPLVKSMQSLQKEIISGTGVRRSAKILSLPNKQA